MNSPQQSFSIGQSGPDPTMLGLYNSAYGNALSLNNKSYADLLKQYSTLQGNIGKQVGGISGDYSKLQGQVLGTIKGIGASQQQQIHDTFAQQMGTMNQGLINSGLGNSTVMGSMARGMTLDESKASIALSNQIAQLTAGYQSQLGGAAINARMQGLGLQSQSGNTLMGALASFRTPYPGWPPNSSFQLGASHGGGGYGEGGPLVGGAYGSGRSPGEPYGGGGYGGNKGLSSYIPGDPTIQASRQLGAGGGIYNMPTSGWSTIGNALQQSGSQPWTTNGQPDPYAQAGVARPGGWEGFGLQAEQSAYQAGGLDEAPGGMNAGDSYGGFDMGGFGGDMNA